MIGLTGYASGTKRHLLTSELAQSIAELLPDRLQLHNHWALKYSLEQHGASLNTLYSLSPSNDGQQHGWVLVLQDEDSGIFGAYLNEPPRPTGGTHYVGNGTSFLWKLTKAGVKGFLYTGKNDFIAFCSHSFFSMGGGDGLYGLWIDDNVNNGVSYPTPTFDNETLSKEGPKFKVVAAELWQI